MGRRLVSGPAGCGGAAGGLAEGGQACPAAVTGRRENKGKNLEKQGTWGFILFLAVGRLPGAIIQPSRKLGKSRISSGGSESRGSGPSCWKKEEKYRKNRGIQLISGELFLRRW